MPAPAFLATRAAPAWAGLVLAMAIVEDGRAQTATGAVEEARAPTVEVTATHTEATLTVPTLELARQTLSLSPGGTEVIDAEVFKTGRASTLQDALGYAAGVFVQPRFGAEEARLSIRGSGIQRTFHLRGIKLLQDGAPLNQADGGGDFQAVEPLAVRYIEVYRGANALEYGSTTLGGAINFVTPAGYQAAPLQARVEAGSFDYLRGQLSVASVQGRADYYLSTSLFSQEGFRAHAQQDTQRVFGNLGLRLNADAETRFYIALVNTESELPGALSKAELEADPTLAAPGNVTGDQKRDFELGRIANRTVWRFGTARLEFNAFYAYKDLFHPIFQVLDQVSNDYGLELRWVNDTQWLGRRTRVVAGFSPARGELKDDRFVNAGGQPGARTDKSDNTAVNLDLYGELQHYVAPDLALVAGGQLSRATRERDDLFGADTSFDATYDGFSPKLGARWEASPQVQVFGNVSRSFEPPSFGELAGGPNVTPVDAQTATTFELGTRGTLPAVTWDVAGYWADVRDELLSVNDGAGNPLGTVNVPRTLHRGIESAATWQPRSDVLVRAAYQLTDFRFDDDPVHGSNRLPGIPRHFLRAEALYQTTAGFYAGPTLEWSPEKYPVDMVNSLYADPYFLLGAKFGVRRPKGWSWFVEGRNLTDETYAATTNVTNVAPPSSRQYFPGDGVSVYAGLEWRR